MSCVFLFSAATVCTFFVYDVAQEQHRMSASVSRMNEQSSREKRLRTASSPKLSFTVSFLWRHAYLPQISGRDGRVLELDDEPLSKRIAQSLRILLHLPIRRSCRLTMYTPSTG